MEYLSKPVMYNKSYSYWEFICCVWNEPFARTHARRLLHHWSTAVSAMFWSGLHQIWISCCLSGAMFLHRRPYMRVNVVEVWAVWEATDPVTSLHAAVW